jgi:mannan endo-1,4-beta-mannosidase
MQWAHFASGAAGGGMRWPNRHPHRLTGGMRRAQKVLADFVGHIDWSGFQRVNLNEEVKISGRGTCVFACGDERQALIWVVRRDTLTKAGTLDRGVAPVALRVTVPGLSAGRYRVTACDTATGASSEPFVAEARGGEGLVFHAPPFVADIAIAITPDKST